MLRCIENHGPVKLYNMQSLSDTLIVCLSLLSQHYIETDCKTFMIWLTTVLYCMQPTPVTTCEHTHIKHTGIGMCCVCIIWGYFQLNEILMCLIFAFQWRWRIRPIINQGQNIPKYSSTIYYLLLFLNFCEIILICEAYDKYLWLCL